eukprot:scaffold202092_cov16-Tisochrysis_lutea.AAC.2
MNAQAQEQMAAHGIVPLLAGQLLGAADTLEPALRLGSLQLLQLLTAGGPRHIIHDGSLGAVLRVIVACMQDHRQQPGMCGMGLRLLQELAYSRKSGGKRHGFDKAAKALLDLRSCLNNHGIAIVSLSICVVSMPVRNMWPHNDGANE